MRDSVRHLRRRSERGQAIVLVAIMFVVLLGFAGLAVDVSSAYSQRRFERSVADAAALAGAQDLQVATSRSVTTAERLSARTDALQSLMDQLGVTVLMAGPCDPNSDITDCALAPYHVSIKTPALSCVTCDPNHSVQVGVHNPNFQTAFARLFGQATWDVGLASVAGVDLSAKYAVVTLQPPKPKADGSDANLNKDLVVSGNNTVVNVVQGDIGSNTSATTTLAARIQLADGYFIDHYDDLSVIGDTWTKPDGVHPIGRKINSLITDPMYRYASFAGAPTFSTQAAGTTACSGANWPTDYTALLAGAVCYQPGIYQAEFDVGTGGGPNVAYLMPGAYSFPNGMKVRGTLAGGLISSQPGVVMVIPQDQVIGAQNAVNFVLNAGGETCNSDACRATAAIDFSGTAVRTSQGLPIAIEVTRDDQCFSGATPIISASCAVNQNNTVNLAGTGKLLVGGVLYGPSDNMQINGNSPQGGVVGQLYSWSVTYTGGSTLTQSYPGQLGLGVLRLDAACTLPPLPSSCAP